MSISDITLPPVLFITGVGTDVGKSIATGWLAREMANAGLNVITQKMIQTGNLDMSEDILRHREIMGIELQTVDRLHITAPIIYTYPASPHLAAAIDGRSTDLSVIDSATASLTKQYAHVLVEGAGGLMVPITEDYLTADYLHDRQIPTIVVINGQLGSINHALLTLHTLKTYDIPLFGVIYNPFFDKDPIICADTKRYLREWLSINFENAVWLEMPMKV
ncbi:MAG: dethiobiotin synthase [Muribaculaceae bacterium]|nr:dethiobiotin synthase [Muribaculaceae bacterium]